MLWSLISSAYVIYLYRKLRSERDPGPTDAGAGGIDDEIDRLNDRIRALEARLAAGMGRETAR